MILTVTLNPSLDEWVRLPRLRIGRVNRATAFQRYPGGKGINVSRVVRELGGQTCALACAGGDDGHILSRLLDAHRLAHRFVHVEGTTRNNYQIMTDTPRAITQINCPGPTISASTLRQVMRRLATIRPKPAAVVCSGSLPPGLSSGSYRPVLQAAAARGALTVLDTSGPALRQGVAARPWLIKPNREEAEELLSERLTSPARVVRAATALAGRKAGASVVIISLGAEGAVLAAADGPRLVAEAPRVRVNSTVGAGDSLVAGFVTGWLRSRSLVDALRLGMACGTATVMTPGTHLCRRRDVERLRPQVKIRPA